MIITSSYRSIWYLFLSYLLVAVIYLVLIPKELTVFIIVTTVAIISGIVLRIITKRTFELVGNRLVYRNIFGKEVIDVGKLKKVSFTDRLSSRDRYTWKMTFTGSDMEKSVNVTQFKISDIGVLAKQIKDQNTRVSLNSLLENITSGDYSGYNKVRLHRSLFFVIVLLIIFLVSYLKYLSK